MSKETEKNFLEEKFEKELEDRFMRRKTDGITHRHSSKYDVFKDGIKVLKTVDRAAALSYISRFSEGMSFKDAMKSGRWGLFKDGELLHGSDSVSKAKVKGLIYDPL